MALLAWMVSVEFALSFFDNGVLQRAAPGPSVTALAADGTFDESFGAEGGRALTADKGMATRMCSPSCSGRC